MSDYETWLIEDEARREQEMDEVMHRRHLFDKAEAKREAELRWQKLLDESPF